MLTYSKMLALHDGALADTGPLVDGAARGDLGVATPCEGWNLADLLSHMIGQNRGFAAAVTAGDAEAASYAGPEVTPANAVGEWGASAEALRAAFGAADENATAHLAELDIDVTAAGALSMQLLDTAVHAWDVATALGDTYRPDDSVTELVLDLARKIASRPGRSPGVFGGALAERGDDGWFDALRLLGRDPRPVG
ncbi:TIGR03086 family protein [Promicromonospora umidemergens]|uniref:TIGR03086 family metal-binding protein n=1 Tax=Promicromonospora umidemergens TaxID=629679 RepID=UPI0020A3FD1F|nr:TIGR03086 family metal-binding protein [Promicromonospora umidemergens]MCP2282336.1 TIGR03086 family protein [Promicromonospora umidemergens]